MFTASEVQSAADVAAHRTERSSTAYAVGGRHHVLSANTIDSRAAPAAATITIQIGTVDGRDLRRRAVRPPMPSGDRGRHGGNNLFAGIFGDLSRITTVTKTATAVITTIDEGRPRCRLLSGDCFAAQLYCRNCPALNAKITMLDGRDSPAATTSQTQAACSKALRGEARPLPSSMEIRSMCRMET